MNIQTLVRRHKLSLDNIQICIREYTEEYEITEWIVHFQSKNLVELYRD